MVSSMSKKVMENVDFPSKSLPSPWRRRKSSFYCVFKRIALLFIDTPCVEAGLMSGIVLQL